jgi:hypothetical protein
VVLGFAFIADVPHLPECPPGIFGN